MSQPPHDAYPWMRPPESLEPYEDYCDRCDRPVRPHESCLACGDEPPRWPDEK